MQAEITRLAQLTHQQATDLAQVQGQLLTQAQAAGQAQAALAQVQGQLQATQASQAAQAAQGQPQAPGARRPFAPGDLARVTVFRGTPSENPAEWFGNYESLVEVGNIEYNSAVHALGMLLVDSANPVYKAAAQQAVQGELPQARYARVRDAVMAVFFSIDVREGNRRVLEARRRLPGETIEAYFTDVARLIRFIDPEMPVRDQVRYARAGLAAEMKMALALHGDGDFNSCMDFLALARRWENESKSASTSARPVAAVRQEDDDAEDAVAAVGHRGRQQGGGPRCYNCGRQGHIARECRAPVRRKDGAGKDSGKTGGKKHF